MKRNRHRSWDGAGVERSCGDPDPPAGAASILPSLTQTHLRDPRPGCSSLTAPPAPAEQPHPKGIIIQALREFCSCSKHRGLFPSLPSPHARCAQGASPQLPSLPCQAECGAATRPLLSPCQECSQSLAAPEQGRRKGEVSPGAERGPGRDTIPPFGYLELQPGQENAGG